MVWSWMGLYWRRHYRPSPRSFSPRPPEAGTMGRCHSHEVLPMVAAMLTLHFHLEGCHSLKERRQRLGGLRDRFGRPPQPAGCEAPGEPLPPASWHFLALAQTRPQLARTLARCEQFAATSLDAVITAQSLEWL